VKLQKKLIDMQHGFHLAFLKRFARKRMIWPFGLFWPILAYFGLFWPFRHFLNFEEKSLFKTCFGEI